MHSLNNVVAISSTMASTENGQVHSARTDSQQTTTSSTTAPTATSASALDRNSAVQACIMASALAKQAAELAFELKGRSMTAPDVLEQIGSAFRILFPEG